MESGGWLMVPIVACSLIAAAVVLERFWVLRTRRIMPAQLVTQIWQWNRQGELNAKRVADVRDGSPLGRMLAAGLVNRRHSREVMKEAINDVGRHVVADLERNLNTLGTIAAVAPLLGLLGTVFGMIQIFSVIVNVGTGNAGLLAGGIAQALITTAAGLCVGIPALMFHRYFDNRVTKLAVAMEEQALKLVEVMKGEREQSEDRA
jgi:biopolymer transport protein ExbB